MTAQAPAADLPLAAQPAQARAKGHGRSLWWVVHHWLGLKLSLFMTFVLLTGTVAVFAHEIDWLFTPAMRVQPQDRPHASWGAWAAAIQRAEPDGEIQSIGYPIDPWFAARATVIRESGQRVYVNVNPWTAQVTGVTGWGNVHRFLRNTHRHLMMPVKFGVPIVCSMAFVLLISLTTGLVAYKKFWRGFLRIPKWRRGRQGELRRFSGDLHRWAGLWSLWFVLLIAITGVWYFVEELGGEAPRLPRPQVETAFALPVGADLDRLIAAARRADPELRIRSLNLPDDGGPGLTVEGQARAWLVRERANAVFVEPETAEVLLTTRGERLNVHQRISEMADPLHFGTFGGLLTKTLWFLFGAAMTGLSITGVMIYSLRLKRAEAAGGKRGPLRRAWDGLGPFAYVAAGLILISLWLTPAGLSGGG